MSSVSGDENNEVAENEPVRRTRSGRAVKVVTPTANKKTPVKKPATRATRASKTIPEIEEESHNEEEDNTASENGMQQQQETQDQETQEQEMQEEEQDTSAIQLKLDETQENIDEQAAEQAEEQVEEQVEEQTEEQIEEQAEVEMCQQEEESEVQDQEMDQQEEGQQILEDDVENEDREILQDATIEQETPMETEPIPEFDPDEMSQEQETLTDTDAVTEDQLQDSVAESKEPVEAPAQNECTLKVKNTVELMDDDVDDQCILIEDDVDHTFLEEELERTSEKKLESNLRSTNECDEIIEISDQENDIPSKKIEPDTEAVSEDELPTESAKEPETEAVSDEELPVAQPADLGETESVSEDEFPIESEKKRKGSKSSKGSEKKSKVDTLNKRKRIVEGEYDPSSPTSENNDETPAKKVAISADADSAEKSDAKPTSPKKKTLPELEKYWKAVNEDPSDFTGWTYLLQYVDQENDAEAAREAYTKFLERYPYCYGYWRKFADYEKKKGDPERVQTVFDEGLKAISLSVDLWLHYINHCKAVYEKDEDKMREQYERAIEACGLEFRSDRLWESYLKWEMDNKRYNKVMGIYDRLLCTPTLGYMSHFETFQEFVTTNSPQKVLSVDDFLALRTEVKTLLKSDETATDDVPPGEDTPTSEPPPTDEETRAIREKVISSRRKMHKQNVNAVAARWTFEEGIKRPYFHVKPLERCQLKNWKEYLDYEIEQKDQNRVIVLFERCLIACALYDEFWMRFIRFLESLKGDNVQKIRDVYHRACTVHHPKKPNLHLQWATYEESMGNYVKAANILENIDNVTPNMLQIAYRRINLERRRGDLEQSCTLYESYINSSKNRTIANNIAVKYARFLCKIKNDTDKAVKVLLKATEKDKDNIRLYLQLIDIGLQRNPIDVQEVVGYMDLFIDREHADLEQRVLFAQRKVEFLEDFSTDIRQVLKAHEQFQKCIKQAKERKKVKSEESKSESAPKKAKIDTSAAPPAPAQSYQYGSSTAPYQSQQQYQSGQYSSQSGYQQGYQQYPPPSDPNYANYQNWQYGQSGPQAYAPYNQWGSYSYY